MKLFVLVLLPSVLVPLPAAHATTYYVDKTNGAASDSLNAGTNPALPWLTIGKCASTIVAGDTCQVQVGGTYNERVEETTDGTAGSPIIYQAQTGSPRPKVRGFTINGADYVTVTGFEITTSGMSADSVASVWLVGGNHDSLINSYIHDTQAACVRVDNATFPIVRGNTISHCGVPVFAGGGAIGVLATTPVTDMLIEDNKISYVADFFNTGGDKWVVRNNTIGPSDPLNAIHIDGFQMNTVTTNALGEGNLSIDNNSSDNHFFLNSVPSGTDHWILRFNSTCRSKGGVDVRNLNKMYFYNNTFYDNGLYLIGTADQMDPFTNSTGNFSYNNIWKRSTSPESISPYSPAVPPVLTKDYDLWFQTGNPGETHSVNADPLVVDAANCDFHLQAASPAVKAGGPLTTVHASDTGSGTSLVVTDAGFFQPGWAGVSPDWIAVGSISNTAQISSINYSANAITLAAPITRTPGQPVWLYKNSSGTTVLYATRDKTAPDLGAFPVPTPAPPTNLKVVVQ